MYSYKPPHLSAPPPGSPYATGVSSLAQTTSWSTGLFDCCIDIPNCCLTCWCPCIVFGQIAEIVDKGTTSCGVHGIRYGLINVLTGCGCLYSCMYRTKMRRQQGLPEVPTNDCCVHFCCGPCALCQEYRELQSRGYDMSIGWEEGNNRQIPNGVQIPPVAIGGMNR